MRTSIYIQSHIIRTTTLNILNIIKTPHPQDIERIRVGQEPKPKKKIYATRDSRLKRIVGSYDFEYVRDYLGRVAANVKLNP